MESFQNSLENKFSISKIIKTSLPDYGKALSIYNEVTSVEIETNPEEITEMLSMDKHQSFKLYGFILYYNGEVSGLALLTYLSGSKVLLVEYIALTKNLRTNASFLVYLGLLRKYMSDKLNISYWATEINDLLPKSIDKESKLFKSLIPLEGFGALDAMYITLDIGINNFESSFKAKIYLKANEKKEEISVKTYLQIVESIYEYSKEWFLTFNADPDNLYQKQIEQNLSIIKKTKILNDRIAIEYFETEKILLTEETTSAPLPAVTGRSTRQRFFLSSIILIALFLALPIIKFVLNLYGIQLSDVQSLLGQIFAAILTLFYLKKENN